MHNNTCLATQFAFFVLHVSCSAYYWHSFNHSSPVVHTTMTITQRSITRRQIMNNYANWGAWSYSGWMLRCGQQFWRCWPFLRRINRYNFKLVYIEAQHYSACDRDKYYGTRKLRFWLLQAILEQLLSNMRIDGVRGGRVFIMLNCGNSNPR